MNEAEKIRLRQFKNICNNKISIQRPQTLMFNSLTSTNYLNMDLLLLNLCKKILKIN